MNFGISLKTNVSSAINGWLTKCKNIHKKKYERRNVKNK